MRRLFVDLDETLIFTRDLRSSASEIRSAPDFIMQLDLQQRALYLRPDWGELIGIPFTIFTSAGWIYAQIAAEYLSSIGLNIEEVISSDQIHNMAYPPDDEELQDPRISEPAFLIDDLPLESVGYDIKKRAFKNLIYCMINPLNLSRDSLYIRTDVGSSLSECLEKYNTAESGMVENPAFFKGQPYTYANIKSIGSMFAVPDLIVLKSLKEFDTTFEVFFSQETFFHTVLGWFKKHGWDGWRKWKKATQENLPRIGHFIYLPTVFPAVPIEEIENISNQHLIDYSGNPIPINLAWDINLNLMNQKIWFIIENTVAFNKWFLG